MSPTSKEEAGNSVKYNVTFTSRIIFLECVDKFVRAPRKTKYYILTLHRP